MSELQRGDQVVYIPNHVLTQVHFAEMSLEEAIEHKDSEFGFVTSQGLNPTEYFVRYWRKDMNPNQPSLRTTTCSEVTSIENLILYNSVDPIFVDSWLADEADWKKQDENRSK